MQREIKFRGKTVNDNEWIYGMTISKGTIKRKANKFFMEVEENRWKGLQDGSLGQYTGLKDKNGKEIYEGDILTWSRNGIESSPLVIEYKHGAFGYTYSEGSFVALAGNSNFAFNPFNNDKRFQIIGNIHDNPELIKEE